MIYTVVYGLFAFVAFWATWRDADLRWVGIWLTIGWATTNLLCWYAPVEVRPGPYTLIEMMIGIAAFCAYGAHEKRWYRHLMTAVVICNIGSTCANIAFAASFPPMYRQIHLYEVTTNLFFAAECLLAIGAGVADGYRTGRFAWRTRLPCRAAQSNARQEGRE